MLERVRRLKIRVVLATDLLSRGIDLPNVNLVVNYDLPLFHSEYLHRIGRTGRFGLQGVAVSLLPKTGRTYLQQRIDLGLVKPLPPSVEELQSFLDSALETNGLAAE